MSTVPLSGGPEPLEATPDGHPEDGYRCASVLLYPHSTPETAPPPPPWGSTRNDLRNILLGPSWHSLSESAIVEGVRGLLPPRASGGVDERCSRLTLPALPRQRGRGRRLDR